MGFILPLCHSETIDRRPLSAASLAKCDELLMKMAVHYKYHGINIKTCYADFDKHHIGVVTEPQVNRQYIWHPPLSSHGVLKILLQWHGYAQNHPPTLSLYINPYR